MQAIWGIDADGGPVRVDLDATPHVLIGGTDGAGLEEAVRGFVAALRRAHPPQEVRLLLAEPHGHLFGRIGLTVVAGSPYLVARLNEVLLGELDATWCARTAPGGVRLASWSFTGSYLRHINAALWLATPGGSAAQDNPGSLVPDITWAATSTWAP